MAFKRKFAKKHFGAKKRVKRVIRKRKTSTFASRVRKVVEKEAEHKKYSYLFGGVGCSGVSTTYHQFDTTTAFAYIAQGTACNQRVGDQIRIVSVKLRGAFTPMPYNAVTNIQPLPLDVRCIFSSNKNLRGGAPALATMTFAAGAPTAFANNLSDVWVMLDKETQSVKKDTKFKLGTSAQPVGGATYPPNNDYKYNKFVNWDLTKMYPKNLTYQSGAVIINAPAVFLTVVPQPADNSGNPAASVPLQFQGVLDVVWVDV